MEIQRLGVFFVMFTSCTPCEVHMFLVRASAEDNKKGMRLIGNREKLFLFF